MAQPFMSVVINTHNHELFIADAIRSVLAQGGLPRSDFEIIVVDDGSTDRTPEIVRQFEPDVRLFQKENGDQCSAIPYGVARAKGEIVAFLDGDDVWLPQKLSRVANRFAEDSCAAMVYHRYVFWDSRNGATWEPDDPSNVSGDVLSDRRKLLRYAAPPTSSLAFRREAFQRLTNIHPGRAFAYDLFITSAILFVGPVASIPEVLTKNRVHGNNRWVAGKEGPDKAKLHRRIARRAEAIEVLRDWIWANAPKSLRPQARVILRGHSLARQIDSIRLAQPGRLEFFRYRIRYNLHFAPVMTRSHLTFRWVRAFVYLILGRHGHYFEGVRTRAKSLRQRFHARTAPVDSGESAERVS